MLRGVITLLQNFLAISSLESQFSRDTKKRSNNTVVRYMKNSPEHTLNMDLELKGKNDDFIRKSSMEMLQLNEKGDLIDEKAKTSFVNENQSTVGDSKTNETLKKLSKTNLNELIEKSPKLHQKIAKKNREIIDKGKDQLQILLEQVNKMKTGIHRLQEIAQKFNSTDSFKENVQFLVNNVKPALEKSEVNKNIEASKEA
ncbi:unnamed protein product [Brassicogethes aeneus]|uniref:Uncharacterized protein n=1 Tax=Brassicogethes aeneus TaxID=1431903 RepID=A0A9P0AVP4_BRAAE|nr:unnamed protein product [Brassicogethes aeneus]